MGINLYDDQKIYQSHDCSKIRNKSAKISYFYRDGDESEHKIWTMRYLRTDYNS